MGCLLELAGPEVMSRPFAVHVLCGDHSLGQRYLVAGLEGLPVPRRIGRRRSWGRSTVPVPGDRLASGAPEIPGHYATAPSSHRGTQPILQRGCCSFSVEEDTDSASL